MQKLKNFEREDILRIFRNFEFSSIKITRVDFFYFNFFYRLFELFEYSKYIYDNLPSNSKFLEFRYFTSCQILKIC